MQYVQRENNQTTRKIFTVYVLLRYSASQGNSEAARYLRYVFDLEDFTLSPVAKLFRAVEGDNELIPVGSVLLPILLLLPFFLLPLLVVFFLLLVFLLFTLTCLAVRKKGWDGENVPRCCLCTRAKTSSHPHAERKLCLRGNVP